MRPGRCTQHLDQMSRKRGVILKRTGWRLVLGVLALAMLPMAASGLSISSHIASVTNPAAAEPCNRVGHVAGSVTFGSPRWTVCVGSTITQSSPSVATLNGSTFVAIGDENGYVHLLDAATGQELPGWPQRMYTAAGASTAIESSPTIAFLNGNSNPPTIIVGSASTWVKNRTGEVEAFNFDGSRRFVFKVGAAATTRVGVISTPAVGDIVGNGQLQIVFGAWDHRIYVLNAAGKQLGFAYDNADTVWSSPTLVRQPGQRGSDVILGSDASGRTTPGSPGGRCVGGFLADYRFTPGASDPDTRKTGPGLQRIWFHCLNQSIWSSPSLGKIRHKMVVFVGTSFFEQPFPSDTNHLFAFYARNGAPVPGWPVSTPGPVLGSAAIGTIAKGVQGVVAVSFLCAGATKQSCSNSGHSAVLAFSIGGQPLWRDGLLGPTAFGSPTLTPLLGEATNDVLVSTPNGLYPLKGGTGAALFGTNFSNQFAAVNPGCRSFSTPAVADVSEAGQDVGWMVIESCGGPPQFGAPGEIVAFRLPTQPAGALASPIFGGSPTHTGQALPPTAN